MLMIKRFPFIVSVISFVLFSKNNAFGKTSKNILFSQIVRLYSMRLNITEDKVIIRNSYNAIEFEKNGRRAWINGTMIYLHEPSRRLGINWSIIDVDFNNYIDPIIRSYKYSNNRIPKKIVIDPGHGGKDSGAISKKQLYEKSVTLNISLYLKLFLEKYGFEVYLTRYDDRYVSLQSRINFTTKIKADLFVSIHADSAVASANGVGTFITTSEGLDSSNHYGKKDDKSSVINNRFDPANAILGFSLHSNLLKTSKRKDRGLRRARFSVIKNAPCPAALVECGFLSNISEEALLRDKKYLQNVAYGITNGIRAYKILIERATS